MAGRQRWWVAVLVCGALSIVPFAAAFYIDASPVGGRPMPSPPLSQHTAPEAEPDFEVVPPPPTTETERMDAPPALDDSEEPVATSEQDARVSGRVVDERGFAVTRFELAIESFWPAGESGRRPERRRGEIADDDGRFEIDGLVPGTYVLAVRADGHPPSNSERLELRAGDDERGVRIVLARGGVVEGRVHDGGTPIAGARVSLDLTSGAFGDTASAVSDESGGYRLDGIPGGPVSLRFEAKGYGTRIVSAVTAR
ncbi:MAG TPA: carboxypeptidase-like regulatory domain-containing protein, partial [Polyangiaceae bacterium]|nr:carboxypeptidase-like regulatory domain-containing protein [Polyangiaceae bacterium]